MARLVNKRELAEIVGKSEVTLTTWSKQGMPIAVASTRGKAHSFDTVAVIQWMLKRERDKAALSPDGSYDLTEERARLSHHQANIEEMKEREQKGKLIPAELVILFGSGMISAARAKLLAAHSKIKSRFPQLDQAVINEIENIHSEALSELGNDGLPPELRERIHGNTDHLDTTPESDSEPVG